MRRRISLRNIPIRARVALAILTLSSAALVAMAIGVYLAFASGLRANLDDTLRTRAASNATLVDHSSGALKLRLTADPGNERGSGDTALRLFGASGEVVADGAPDAGTSPTEGALAGLVLKDGVERFATVDHGGGERFRVLLTPVVDAGAIRGVLLTGADSSLIDDPLSILRLILMIAVPTTSLALAIGAFFIAKSALRPVERITVSANRIASGDLRERISGIHSRDEVGELAATFNHMIDRVAETVERERRFTADAAHELRTPLAALETSIDVTLSQPRTAKRYEEALVAMRGQTTRLTSLMRQLLLLSRVDADAVAATFEEFDLAPFLGAVVASFSDSHPRVTLETSGLDRELRCRGDFEQLTRAFGNVLENAVVHGSAEARIQLVATREGRRARVVIHDDGPGIPEGIRDSAFQRFRRGDAARSRPGAGLGLAIVESVIHLHGGAVRILPGGPGTAIEFTLPLAA